MPPCTKKHYHVNNKSHTKIPCYFIRGICITDPLAQGGLEMFLRTTFPYFHGPTYKESLRWRKDKVPSRLPIANTNR